MQPSAKRENVLHQVTENLALRKTPHLPPRSQTPRHTNIGGSPIRHSPTRSIARETDGSPRRARSQSQSPVKTPNRLLDFSRSEVLRSVEKSPSPEKPRPILSAKAGKQRKSIFEYDLSPERTRRERSNSEDMSDAIDATMRAVDSLVETLEVERQETVFEVPQAKMVATPDKHVQPVDDFAYAEDQQYDTSVLGEHTEASNIKRKREGARESELGDEAQVDTPTIVDTPRKTNEVPRSPENITPRSSGKRKRITMEPKDADKYTPVNDTLNSATISPSIEVEADYIDVRSISPSSASSYIAGPERTPGPEEYEEDQDEAQSVPSKRHQSRPVAQKAPRTTKIARGRGPPRKSQQSTAPPRASRDKSDTDSGSPSEDMVGARRAPKSSIELRAQTPMEDEGVTLTRSGRVSIKPLQYWKNEQFVWRHGEVDGVVRAHEVEQPKRKVTKRKGTGRLGSIMEEGSQADEPEDLLPEVWESELGVINGPVRIWDQNLQNGRIDAEMEEDIAFASTSIAVRDVQGSAFRYAKIMTLPFFGSGVVELPPGGYKRSKNSRKMQMVFFVHEGKVTIDVAGMTFGLTKGGVWQVPRGMLVVSLSILPQNADTCQVIHMRSRTRAPRTQRRYSSRKVVRLALVSKRGLRRPQLEQLLVQATFPVLGSYGDLRRRSHDIVGCSLCCPRKRYPQPVGTTIPTGSNAITA